MAVEAPAVVAPAPTVTMAVEADGRCPPGMVSVEYPGRQDVPPEGYCIDRLELSVARYRECVARGACAAPSSAAAAGWYGPGDAAYWSTFCNAGRAGREAHPMNCVTRDEAATYCRWRGARLPTRAEWEFAARGAAGRTYPWGEAAPDAARLNACGTECRAEIERSGRIWSVMYLASDGYADTAPVGSFPAGASEFGVLDLLGNVWEWVSDVGSAEGNVGFYQGRGWADHDANGLRVGWRGESSITMRVPDLGFRCAVSTRTR